VALFLILLGIIGGAATVLWAVPPGSQSALPLAVYLALVLVAALAGFVFLGVAAERWLRYRPVVRRVALALTSLGFCVALLQGVPAVVLAHRLASSPPKVRDLYDQVFNGGTAGGTAGLSANYIPHPYLDFTLNPQAAYMGERQFDEHYRIRRKEPIRPRREVAWRALALGGSTTFGEMTAREEDTWVYRLEQKIRAAHGPRYDVINGGVGGYNIIENFIHYVLMLDELEPDVVLLYVGLNDVHPRLMGHLERDYSNSRLAWRGDEHSLPTVNPFLSRYPLYRYFMLRLIERRTFDHLFAYVQRPYPPDSEWPEALRRNGTEIYQAHLENLVRLLLAQGRQVVIVPQVDLPRTTLAADRVFAQGVAEQNAANETVARKYGVPYLASVASAFTVDDLIDNCHFNNTGHEKMATLLFQYLSTDGAALRPDPGGLTAEEPSVDAAVGRP
jgi:lysophospholipase L1-like esterase